VESALAKHSPTQNGHDHLEEATALLIQNQASFLGRLAEAERVSAERFGRIEADISSILRVLGEHSRVLAEHSRLLQRLPEAVREKIGFKPPQ
jgi:hypothetical protein